MSGRREVILLSAFVVHPDMPSEPGIGWQFLTAALEHAHEHDMGVVLLTNRRSAAAVDGRVSERLRTRLVVVAVDIPFAPSFFRWHEPSFTRFEHEVWVRLAARRVPQIERDHRVLFAHHVTFATEILATPITRSAPGVLRVWGPVGAGGVAAVYRMEPRSWASRRQWVMQRARDGVAGTRARSIARRCDLVIAQNTATAAAVSSTGVEVRVFPNVVVDGPTAVDRDEPRAPGALRLLVVGHLIPRKRPELAVALLARPQLAEARMTFLGDATVDFAAEVSDLADELGVRSRVTFAGVCDHRRVIDEMMHADVLVHTSGREGASGVVGEASAVGLPVVCFGGTGAASVLEEAGTSGVVVDVMPTTTLDDVADAVAAAAAMARTITRMWTTARFRYLIDDLARVARARQATTEDVR